MSSVSIPRKGLLATRTSTHKVPANGVNVLVSSSVPAKVLFTGRVHTTSGPKGLTRSSDGFIDLKLPQPHPAAEQLFASAWSACYLGAIELAATHRKVKLPEPPSIDTQIELNHDGSSYFLRALLNVSMPGVDRTVAEELAEAAHGICPYSKAVHGNIEISTNVI